MQSSKVRQFLVIVAFVFVAWTVVSMSQTQTYRSVVSVEWRGYDTARYVVVQADTTISINVTSNGFQAVRRWRLLRQAPLRLNAKTNTTYPLVDVLDAIERQYGLEEAVRATSNKSALSIRLAERHHRAYLPDIGKVKFEFADQYGIAGEVKVTPDSIYLYGSEGSLSKIDAVEAREYTFPSISKTGDYLVQLNPNWERYPDVHPSATKLRLHIDVEKYVERRYTVPVTLSTRDTTLRIRLYPDNVTVSLLVPMHQYKELTSDMVEVQAVYDADARRSQLPLLVTKFPSYCRVKQVSPAEVEYVALKK